MDDNDDEQERRAELAYHQRVLDELYLEDCDSTVTFGPFSWNQIGSRRDCALAFRQWKMEYGTSLELKAHKAVHAIKRVVQNTRRVFAVVKKRRNVYREFPYRVGVRESAVEQKWDLVSKECSTALAIIYNEVGQGFDILVRRMAAYGLLDRINYLTVILAVAVLLADGENLRHMPEFVFMTTKNEKEEWMYKLLCYLVQ